MIASGIHVRGRRLAGLALTAAMIGGLVPAFGGQALAAVTAPNLGTIALSADNAQTGQTPSYTNLGTVTLTEGAAGDIQPDGVITLDLTGNFAFRTINVAAAFSASAGTCGLTATLGSPTATSIPVTIGGTATTGTNRCRLTVTGVQVQATTTTAPQSTDVTISKTGTAINGISNGTTIATLSETPGAAYDVALNWTPEALTGGQIFAVAPTVDVADRYGNTMAYNVTLGLTGGTAGAHVTCTQNTITTNSSGHGSWANCSVDKVGTNYRLVATSGTATDQSGTFSVTAGTATKLVFTAAPSGAVTSALGNITVQATDAGGNAVAASATVTLSISSNSGSFTCSTTTPLTGRALNSAGSFTWTGCQQTAVGTYTLTATQVGGSASLLPATSGSFSVTSGPGSKVQICWGISLPCVTTPPSPIVGGVAFTTQPVVRILDANNNLVTSDSSTTVALSIYAGTPTSGGPGTLTCTNGLQMTVTGGIAQYSGCAIDKVGTGYRLYAASNPVLTAYATYNPTTAFNVIAGAPTKLVFTTQPIGGASRTAWTTQPVVSITDAGGNVVTTTTATVTLAIGTNPAGGTLTCTSGNTRTTSLGVATFAGCSIDNAGAGYTLTATASNVSPAATLTSATSNAFNITAPAAQITLFTSNTVIVWARPVTLTVQFGTNGANKAFVLQRSTDNVTWGAVPFAPTTTNSLGTASFTTTPDRNYWYRVMFAGTGDLSAANSNVVRVVVRQIALLRPLVSGVKVVSKGSKVTFTTTVRPARTDLAPAKVTFTFKLYRAGHLVYNGKRDVYIDSAGRASWTWTFGSSGDWYVRAIANPTRSNANSVWSQIDHYRVP